MGMGMGITIGHTLHNRIFHFYLNEQSNSMMMHKYLKEEKKIESFSDAKLIRLPYGRRYTYC